MRMKDFMPMILILLFFYGIAVGLWLATGALFYLVNFGIIGTSLGLGMGLFPVLKRGRKQIARRLSQALVGGYMFFGLGCGLISILFGYIVPENMQIEGFWFLLLGGIFAGAVIHYIIAKIFGTVLLNRGWCGWACWTAAVLDYLPWKRSPGRLDKGFGRLRYLHFALATGLVFFLIFGLGLNDKVLSGHVVLQGVKPWPGLPVYDTVFRIPQFWWFITGNILYFGLGILLAAGLKDNRAFCKYVCPIVTFMKPGACASVTRIKPRIEGCTQCGACEKICPMDIKIRGYIMEKKRVLSTECILCLNCVYTCPNGVLSLSAGIDPTIDEKIRMRGEKL